MKNKVKLLLLTICMFLLAGCGYEEIVTISSTGEITTKFYGYGTPQEAKKKGSIATVKINGKKYYKFASTIDSDNWYNITYYDKNGIKCSDRSSSLIDHRYNHDFILNKTMFLDYVDDDPSSIDFNLLTITFPKKIKYTNGKLSKDKKTVTFDYASFRKGDKIYVYTSKKQAMRDNVGPIKLEGLNKYGHLTKAKTLKVKTKEKVKWVKVNGKKQKSTKIKVKKEGKYKVEVKTNKNTATFEFSYDKTKPTYKVEFLDPNNPDEFTITFDDENSGIKYATLTTKPIQSGYTHKNSWGRYALTIYDNAGNKAETVVKNSRPSWK